MAILVSSDIRSTGALGHYLLAAAPHDESLVDGAGQRFEFVMTGGNCTPETHQQDVARTRAQHGQEHRAEGLHVIISVSPGEADPRSLEAGETYFRVACGTIDEVYPGRQWLGAAQRDNGSLEIGADGQVRRVPGKWHFHFIIPNVADREATISWTDKAGNQRSSSYAAGRCMDGDMRNLYRARAVLDRQISQQLGYDNQAYIAEIRRLGRSASVPMADLAARRRDGESAVTPEVLDALRLPPESADHVAEALGESPHDQLRAKIRSAAAQATSWDDLTDRLAASAVEVRTHGASGVSYRWVGDDGTAHKARSRDIATVSGEFTRARLTEQAAENAARIADGQRLEAPEAAVPTRAIAIEDFPRPEYRPGFGPITSTPSKAFELEVAAAGGTHEDRFRLAIDEAIEIDQASDWDQFARSVAKADLSVGHEHGRPTYLKRSPDADLDADGVAIDLDRLGRGYRREDIEDRMGLGKKGRQPGERRSSNEQKGQPIGRGAGRERIAADAALAAARAATAEPEPERESDGSESGRTGPGDDRAERRGDGVDRGGDDAEQRGVDVARKDGDQLHPAADRERPGGGHAVERNPLSRAAVRATQRPDRGAGNEVGQPASAKRGTEHPNDIIARAAKPRAAPGGKDGHGLCD